MKKNEKIFFLFSYLRFFVKAKLIDFYHETILPHFTVTGGI